MIAYLDCISGISGDMFLSSLLDVGFPISILQDLLSKLEIKDLDIDIKKESRHGVSGTKIEIICSDHKESRSFRSIKNIITNSDLDPDIKNKAINIFEIIAKAEAEIHSCSYEDVHFHEIGGLDSIVDIVGVICGLKFLKIDSLIVSPLPLGTGTIKIRHGVIPVPAPATISILKNVPVYGAGISAELVTPTGAALIKYLAKGFGNIPPMVIKNIGYGIGSRDLSERPNLVRIIIGEPSQDKESDTVAVLETNVDDSNPEYLGYLMDRLFVEGALDVTYVPIYMKKNRPAVSIKVICGTNNMNKLMDIIFEETGTLGIRYSFFQRKRLQREIIEVDTPWGRIKAKKIKGINGSIYIRPEYEECLKIAKKYGIPLKKIYESIIQDNKE